MTKQESGDDVVASPCLPFILPMSRVLLTYLDADTLIMSMDMR
jgi:hypothetical protein